MRRLLLAPFVIAFVTPSVAQDGEFIKALEAAQRQRPAVLESSSRIAPAGEPGTPLVIRGRAFAEDGRTPLAGAVVFAYHTDSQGLYDRPGTVHSWRLKGWARTDAEGRFEFATIRPAGYPGGRIAAHVHFTLFAADGGRYHAGELLFEGDPALSPQQKSRGAGAGMFSEIRPVQRDGASERVEINLRIARGARF